MKKLFSLLLALLLFVPSIGFAESPSIVEMHAAYSHPVTGAIEDAGKNEGIGQGMAEGVLDPQALYEEVGGKRLLTIRLHMMDNVSKVSIAAEKRGSGGFSNVSYDSPQGGGEWKDFRFQLPAKDCVIRLSLFIDAMGREVVFYGDMGNKTPGNTDFVLSQEPAALQKPPSEQSPAAKSAVSGKAKVDGQAPASSPVSTPTSGSSSAKSPSANSDKEAVSHGGASGLGETESDIGYDHGLLTEDSPEIKSLEGGATAEGDKTEAPKKKAPWGPATRIVFASMMAILVFVTCGALAAGGLFYVLAQKKRLFNELREEDDSEDFNFEDF